MENIIIYGVGAQARQLKYYIENEKCAKVHAFIVDKAYKKTNELCGLPIVEFEAIEKLYPACSYKMLVSFAYTNMMDNRKEKIENSRLKGYSLYSYISKDARIYSNNIGESVIIYPGTLIAPFVTIGKGCFFEISCSVAHNSIIGDYCFFAPGATVCGEVNIGNNVFAGAGAVVANSLNIRDYSFISANTLVSKNMFENSAINPNGDISKANSFEKMRRMCN